LPDHVIITGCAQLLTLRSESKRDARNHGARRGAALRELSIIRDGALIVREGTIVAVGTRRAMERHTLARGATHIDLGNRVVLPGFVDSHTHLVSAASRADEFEQRLAGASYEEIARAGGGILASAQKLRRAPANKLEAGALGFLRRFAEHGTTTVEAKSGYGLDLASELKILRLHRSIAAKQPVDIVSTFLGAHVVPAEFRKRKNGGDAYIQLIVEEMLPRIARENLAEFCDVYCDRGAFTVEQSRTLLTAAHAWGMEPRLHAEQLARTGAAQLAVNLDAASADHLEQINSADIRALAQSNTVATLLPGCGICLGGSHAAPARKLIEAGAIVALATDFNPGTSPTVSMPMILSLACSQLRMTPAEAISAATINAAYSLRLAEKVGSLEVGKYADLAAFDVADYREIPYYFGMNLCALTMKRGRIIFSRTR
jgi:imidazolonepropionase